MDDFDLFDPALDKIRLDDSDEEPTNNNNNNNNNNPQPPKKNPMKSFTDKCIRCGFPKHIGKKTCALDNWCIKCHERGHKLPKCPLQRSVDSNIKVSTKTSAREEGIEQALKIRKQLDIHFYGSQLIPRYSAHFKTNPYLFNILKTKKN